jgi:hypothetical protein
LLKPARQAAAKTEIGLNRTEAPELGRPREWRRQRNWPSAPAPGNPRFYGLLSADQQERLNALSGSNAGSGAKTVSAANVNIGALCTSQAEFTNVPTEEIASTVSLTDVQQQQLQNLRAASAKASDALKASCPSGIPNTVAGRLDAAQNRVAALIQAVNTIRPAVRDFFASLADEQKGALNIQTEMPLKSEDRG